jgi:general secretion pathway protein K
VIANPRGQRAPAARGFALIIVLWFLVLVAAIGAYILASARMETAIARNIRSSATAEALADGGIAEAVFNQSDTIVPNRWKPDGAPHRLRLEGGELVIRMTDEEGKVNPNLASDRLLAALFESAGVDRTLALHLGAAIADWVGSEPNTRPPGAKLEQYLQAGKTYGPPNAPIESLDELQLVLGMTPEIFAAVRPYLTIYTKKSQPDPANALPVVRRALFLAAQEPLSLQGTSAEADGSSVSDGSSSDNQTTNTAVARTSGAASADAPESVLSIEAIAHLPDGGVFVRDAVVTPDPDKPRGYSVLEWARGVLDE